MLAVTVTALVPGDDAPPRAGEQRRERVVRPREVEPAVDEEQRRRVVRAPLVHRDLQTAAVERVFAQRWRRCEHRRRLRGARGGPESCRVTYISGVNRVGMVAMAGAFG